MRPRFPDPGRASADGLLAVGGDLEPETLVEAYRNGIFPWFGENDPILWWSPDPRMVLFPDEFHCSRRLARRLRQAQYRFSRNAAFHEVIELCAKVPRKGQSGTWIVPAMIKAYMRLHALGLAHSIEVWQDSRLIGGIYGVGLCGVFFAESMFHRQTDASKMAMAELCRIASRQGWRLIDCQFYTPHLASLGAREISRAKFLAILRAETNRPG